MDSKNQMRKTVSSLVVMCALLMLTTACTGGLGLNKEDENVVGTPLRSVSQITKIDGAEKQDIAIFDETTRKIHHFNLADMSYKRSFDVQNASDKHYLLYHDSGNYIVDMSSKNVSIFNRNNKAQHRIFPFEGKPISAAFNSNLGLLIVYDDEMSVGMAKLDSDGNVLNTWVGGPLIFGGSSIVSGDLMGDGRLVLALSNGSFSVVDVNQSMAQKRWVETHFASAYTRISWIGPVTDNPDQIFIKAYGKLAIVNINTQTTVTSIDISGSDYPDKYSKNSDPHVVLRTSNMETSGEIKLAYVKNSQIIVNTFQKQFNQLMVSHLNIANDTWTYIDSKYETYNVYNDADEYREERRLKRRRLSDNLSVVAKSIPSQTQIQMSSNYLFALYPSELGYAVRFGITDNATKEVRAFNIPHFE